ncbi:hypothetical protein FCG13_00900 [Neisseria meningitidis]|nr:hypothetical protein [Neisseria meningitidis]MBG8778585.1 hypothetical protein [Neisseria meningitidis]
MFGFGFFLRFRATSKPSFPRRRESRPLGDGNIQRLSESLGFYIPVFTGMTECCGNPACSVSVFFEVSGNF